MSAISTKKKAPPKRRVFGRLKNQEVGEQLYTFEMVKAVRDKQGNVITEAGVWWWKRRAHKKQLVTLNRIVGGTGRECLVDNIEFQFTVTKHGIEVKRKGFSKPKLVLFDVLVALSKDQQEIFKESEIKK